MQLGDFGLAKWKTGDDPLQTRIMGTLGWDSIQAFVVICQIIYVLQNPKLLIKAKINKLCCYPCRYLAPEYAEEGIVSEGTDVYSFGVILIQLISGRLVGNSNNPEKHQQSLRQWVSSILYVFEYSLNSSIFIAFFEIFTITKKRNLTRFQFQWPW